MLDVLVMELLMVQELAKRPLPPPSAMLVPISSAYLAVDPTGTIKPPSVEPGFRLTSPAAGVAFDIDGDGDLEQVSWTEQGAEVAFLALDVDEDGRITSGRELFGSRTLRETRSGADALIAVSKALGAPLSGSVQDGHKLFEKLLLWTDRNHNGISESSELRLANELFTQIGMGYIVIDKHDEHGNRFRFQGWTEVRTGGPEQGPGTTPRDHFPRVRQMFEVVLKAQ